MLYHLLYPVHSAYGAFRVFRYISFRVLMAILTALLLAFIFGPILIRVLKHRQIGEKIREDGPEHHHIKSGTPTMGGVLIVLSLMLSFLLWVRLDFYYSWIIAFSTVSFAAIGFLDDYLKLFKHNSKGLTVRKKLQLQFLFAVATAGLLVWVGLDTHISLPFFKDLSPDLGVAGFMIFATMVIVGSSNAVNLTDGLDGLAIGPMLVGSLAYLFLSYIAGHAQFSEYLQVTNVKGAGEMAIFCGAVVGAGLGFLWFNTYPAQVFMGDVGSLSLGAALGTVALVCKQELLLILIGGVFVLEAVSVIIQVVSYRTTGKRVFRMAPVHHHFELKGWAEPKIIVRFWIISIILALLALATLKLR